MRSKYGVGRESARLRPAGTHYNLARNMLITSSGVMMPIRWLLSSMTGKLSRLYLSKSSANSFSLAPSWTEMSRS